MMPVHDLRHGSIGTPREAAVSGTALAALLVGGAGVALSLLAVALVAVNGRLPVETPEWGFPAFQHLAALVFVVLGTSIALRRPRNPIGWLVLVAGVLSAAQTAGRQYAIYGLVVDPGGVPAPSVGSWIEEWVWIPILTLLGVLTFLLFPTGRLPSPAWRFVVWLAAVTTVVGSVGAALYAPGRVPGSTNPITGSSVPQAAGYLFAAGGAGLLLCMAAAAVSLVVRYRRAAHLERQQLKWLALGGLFVAVSGSVYSVALVLSGNDYHPLMAVLAVSILGIPATITIAMLRYGLYEVDRLLNRTVVYSLVSAVLVTCYAASIVVLQPLLHVVTGGDAVAVAASTLLVASIFQPVRARVQRSVDRRFMRSRYDTQQTLERFSLRVRDQVDLDVLAHTLVGEAGQAVQPATAAVWLRAR